MSFVLRCRWLVVSIAVAGILLSESRADAADSPTIVFSTWAELVSGIANLAASTTAEGATFMLKEGATLSSSAWPAAFELDLTAAGLDGKTVVVDGGGGTLVYTGTAANATVLDVRASVFESKHVDIQVRNWRIRNDDGGNATGLVGIRHGGINGEFLFQEISIGGPGFHESGSTRAFVIDDYTFVSNLVRVFMSSKGDIVSFEDAVFKAEYSLEIRDSILGDASYGPGPCFDFTAPDFGGKPFPATVHTQGVQYYFCDGMTIDGVHWLSIGDLFDAPRAVTSGIAGSWNPWFSVGRSGTGLGSHTNVDIQQGVLTHLKAASGKMVHFQGDFQSFRADFRSTFVATLPGDPPCKGKKLFGASGVLFDADPGVHGEHVSVQLDVPNDESTGESCFVAEGVVSNFATANAKAMFADGMSGEVTGNKHHYVLLRDQFYLAPGVHQLASDLYDDGSPDDGTGNKICADGGGLSCLDVARATGASQQGFEPTPAARCAHAFTSGEIVDVLCQ